jgi:ABC-type nitrate/sulfonate/bicarbonate transport system substrate-binding protein
MSDAAAFLPTLGRSRRARRTVSQVAGLVASLALTACAAGAAPGERAKPAGAATPAAASTPAAAVPAAAASAPPSAPAPLPLRASFASPTGAVVPLWFAHERGLFREQGLDVEIVYLSGTRSDQGVITGDAPVGYGANVIATRLNGADLVSVAAVSNRVSLTLFTRPGIGNPQELRGKTIATTQPGAAAQLATLVLLRHYGIEPHRDVQLAPTGDASAALALAAQGLADASLQGPPGSLKAVELGLTPLVNVADLGIPFMQTSVGVSQAYMRDHAEEIRRYLRGYIAGVALARADPEAAKATLAKWAQTDDPAILDETYRYFSPIWGRPDFRVQPEGIASILQVLDVPGAATARPEDFVDHRLIDELDRSGFIRESGALP